MAVDVLSEVLIDRPCDQVMETTYVWQPHPSGGTTMTLRNRGEPAGFARIGAPAMAAAMRRANRKDLTRLKSLLEKRTT